MADKRKRVQLEGDEEESKPKQLQQDQPVDSESSDDDMGPMPTTAAAGDDESDDDFGPGLPAAQPITKAIRKELKHEKVFLANLPCAEMYEKSYMHRDRITHVVSAQATDFCITASCDGHVKFWKKMDQGIEFVKLYRAHLGRIIDVALSADNLRFCTIAEDQALKIFDVVTYDMMHMISLDFVPLRCEWVYRPGSAKAVVAVSDRDSPKVYIYDVYKTDAPISVLSSHASPVVCLAYSPNFDVVISADTKGVMDYWSPLADDHRVPDGVTKFRFKMETDLYELAKQKTIPTSITISKTGRRFAVTALDQQVRVFRFRDGKKQYQFNESLEFYDQLQAENKLGVDAMDYGRRQAVENEIFESLNQHLHSIHTGEAKKADEDAIEMGTYAKGANKEYITPVPNVLFDDSGNFLLYATMIGIKVVNMVTGHTVRMLGNVETTERFLHLTLYQGIPNVSSQFRINKAGAAASIGAANARGTTADPTLFASSFKKNRFYCFSRREPVDDDGVTEGRDVFNEKPTKSDQMLAQGIRLKNKLGSEAVIHTSMGDIWVKLMPDRTPKTVENFSVHARNGYYDGCIFHRVIKDFMVQTGDPTGLGNGGESIWGGEFEDEVHDDLKHDSPFTVSMANGGPGTNGSQFFITTVKCPWLDGKHTVFGRVTRGMDTVKTIEMSKVDDTSRPFDEIKIINIDIK